MTRMDMFRRGLARRLTEMEMARRERLRRPLRLEEKMPFSPLRPRGRR